VVNVKIVTLPHGKNLALPSYMSKGASGMDLYAAVEKDVVIYTGKFQLIPTGVAVAIPSRYEGQVRPRSGLALKHGLTLLNTPGTIDSDYRGEVKVLLLNLGAESYTVKKGERIAQLVIQALPEVNLSEVDELPPTGRGEGGFGHTG